MEADDHGFVEITYEVDDTDRIVAVGGAWADFAAANDAPDLARQPPVGRPLWESIDDRTVSELYRQLFAVVRREERELELRCRCDAPDRIRQIAIRLAPGSHPGGVAFSSKIVEERERPATPLLARGSDRRGALLTVCGWCARLYVDGHWLDLDEAVSRLGLLERPPPPLSHGICPDCFAAVEAQAASG